MLKAIKGMFMSAALLISGTAIAHEGHDHGKDKSVKGTVTTIEQNKLTLKGADGKPVNVHVDDKTQFENSGAEGKLADLKTGARVVVQGARMQDGTFHATKVRFGKPGAKANPKATKTDRTPTQVKPAGGAAKPAAATPTHAGHDHTEAKPATR